MPVNFLYNTFGYCKMVSKKLGPKCFALFSLRMLMISMVVNCSGGIMFDQQKFVNPLSANLTKWSKTIKKISRMSNERMKIRIEIKVGRTGASFQTQYVVEIKPLK